jgi:hypothetical protein
MRFNILSKKNKHTVKNHEGAIAYTLTPEMELYSSVVTASLSNQFYETAGERLARIRSLIAKNDPVFVAKLTIYTREQMYMRSIPLVLAVELAKIHTGDALVSKMVGRIVQRADEITELLAFYTLSNNRKEVKKLHRLSKQLQHGLSLAFNKFDEYQFAKYNRKTAITLKDALFILHPKAKDEAQQVLFNKIATDTLQTPYTWETTLSAAGQQHYHSPEKKQLAFRTAWEELIDNNMLGYMAMLRNLRNMLEYNISTSHILKVCTILADEKAVLQSKQLPFRFLSAYRELKSVRHGLTGQVQQALEKALRISVQHLRGFDMHTRIVIACDVSGSMQAPISAKSAIKHYDIGLMLGMLLQHRCTNVVSGMFGDTWKTISMPSGNILANVDEFYKREGEVGYSTNGYLVLQDLINRKYIADKIMLFTDCQLWDSNTNNQNSKNYMVTKWMEYKQIAPQAKLYLFNLAGHNTAPLDVRRNDVYLIAGWSDKVFDVMEAIEAGEDAVSHIQKIEL